MKGGRRFVNLAKSGRFAAQRRVAGAAAGDRGVATRRDAGKKRGPATAGPRTRTRP